MTKHSKNFINALKDDDINILKTIPKSDIHNHGELGGRIEKVEKLIGRKIQRPPEEIKDLAHMEEYIFENVVPIIQTKEGYESLMKAGLQQALDDGVGIYEASTVCSNINLYEGSADKFVEAIDNLHKSVAPQVDFRPEIGIRRTDDFNENRRMVEKLLSVEYFKSIDLYGDEDKVAPEKFQDLFKLAKKKGLKLKVHAGEFCDAESVRRAVELLEVDEVQHGISIVESENIMNWIKKQGVQLNVCPTSNIVLGRVNSYENHPIRKLYDNGIQVTINSDDIFLFNQSVSEEYMNLFKCGLFEAEELDIIRLNGLAI